MRDRPLSSVDNRDTGWLSPAMGSVGDRTVLCSVPLTGELAFTTRGDAVADVAMAAPLAPGHPGMTTLALSVQDGGFLLADHAGPQTVYSGAATAAALGFVPLYGGDLRLWLVWPADASARTRLESNLHALAEAAGCDCLGSARRNHRGSSRRMPRPGSPQPRRNATGMGGLPALRSHGTPIL